MSLTIKSARNPRWANPEQTLINLSVTFVELDHLTGEIPFTASPADTETHGTEVFRRASSGDFGEVAPYEPPSKEELTVRAMEEMNRRMNFATAKIAPLQDAVDLETATIDEIAALRAWKNYRVQLNRIDQQSGFPVLVSWPTRPDESAEVEYA